MNVSTFLNNIKINKTVQITTIVLLYQIIYYIYRYFNKNIIVSKNDYISFVLFPTIFISIVVLFVECNMQFSTRLVVILVKRLFLFGLLFLIKDIKLNLTNFLIGSAIIILYYLFSDREKVYGCQIDGKSLINAYIVSAFIYLIIYFIRKK